VSAAVDSNLPPELRAELLAEIRDYLPAFLGRGASEQRDLLGDVSELLNLEPADLRRVVAVHTCLDERVLAFGDALQRGMRNPAMATRRPRQTTQSVRGPVDWAATVSQRSREGGDPSCFVVRNASRVFDTPENRTVAWLLDRLRASARSGLKEAIGTAPSATADASKWPVRIQRLGAQVERAARTRWLREVTPQEPDAATIQRLRASGNAFYSVAASEAARVLLALASPSVSALTEILCRRYFEPAETWRIYEVCVALRLARAFCDASGRPRKARLLVGAGERGPYARYGFADGSEVSLTYQAWPRGWEGSQLLRLAERHGLSVGPSRPDLFIVRSKPDPDVAILELKASHRPKELAKGLAELLTYIGDRQDRWLGLPAGWLVAPASEAFTDHPHRDGNVWLLSADRVGAAAVERFAPSLPED
jgi:hypothetical protein